MASITQEQLFVWSDIEELGDLERLKLVLDTLPDEPLMKALESKRGQSGVNKYPIRAVWNSLIALVVLQHRSIESLRRELMRNPSLRRLCGFNLAMGAEAVPSAGSYSRFFRTLVQHTPLIQQIFEELVGQCYEQFDEFGKNLAIDGKALPSCAQRAGKVEGDLRGEHEGRWARHVTKSESSDGRITETVKKWFGFTLHLIVDTHYELPVAYTVLPANENEMPVARRLIDRMAEKTPARLNWCEVMCADRGYDDGKLHRKLWDEYEIKPVIDIRRSWKDGESTRVFEKVPTVVYDNKGQVYCICSATGEQKSMVCRGFEKDRNCLKYRCPAAHYGVQCSGKARCRIPEQVRIPLEEDRRIFTPVARDSYKWEKLYAQRSAVERVNSRIDRMFGFEDHTIRGLDKMGLRVGIAFVVMLSFAVGRAREKREEQMRQFCRSA